MRTVVIYPGRFQPFHRGHLATVQRLGKKFSPEDVYVATSNSQDPKKSPFGFGDKQFMINQMGVPTSRILQIQRPYNISEIIDLFGTDDIAVVFAVSDKDQDRIVKLLSNEYYEPYPDDGRVKSIKKNKRAYVLATPVTPFRIQGIDADSATEIREKYIKNNSAGRDQILQDLFGDVDANVREIFDRRLLQPKQPEPAVNESTDYLPETTVTEKWSNKYKRSINCANPRGFSQRAHCQGRKKNESQTLEESSGYSLEGSVTPDLIFSKLWLLQELAAIQPNISTMYVLGSWYGNLAMLIDKTGAPTVEKIINVETNAEFLKTSEKILDSMGIDRVEYMLKDANRLDYRQLDSDSAVVNTSLTDMPGNGWFERLPAGTLTVLQARDQAPGEQFHSVDDILEKFPLREVLYQGSLDLEDPETPYTRFMVIGRR